MPGKWQVKVLEALAHQSPQRLGGLLACCQARTANEHQIVKHAVTRLVARGLVARRARGVYALVVDVEALIRAHYPSTARRRRARRAP
jgi:hypothetical protein